MGIPITFLKGVKSKRAAMLEALNVRTLEDLALLLPRGYEDRTKTARIAQLAPEMEVTVTARILRMDFRQIRRNFSVMNLRVSDGTGDMTITFYNPKYIRSKFEKGAVMHFFGKIVKGYYGLEMTNPVFEVATQETSASQFSGILPIYPLARDLTQNFLRKTVKEALALLPPFQENLPEDLVRKYSLMNRDEAIRTLHNPDSLEKAAQARRRLAFEELFIVQLMLMLMRGNYNKDGLGIHFTGEDQTQKLLAGLPFRLTADQEQVWQEIKQDMESAKPMNRLVLGDVGSGKTVLALLAMTKAIGNGYQAAFMAPTEILAEQHFRKIQPMLDALGYHTVLLTGSLGAAKRRETLEAIRTGSAHCVIGTHALIQKDVVFCKPGIMITDEQHRFGVRQRAILAEQATTPDILVMTATPIPRTLALILYGDMDISRIETMPEGRIPIRTFVENDGRRQRVYAWAKKLIEEGRQVYIVHPLVEESDNMEMDALLSATENYEKLSRSVFKEIPCGLVHGRMPSREKDDVMSRFAAGEIKILFSTTVIEVGVDVPNASLMIIENAERFGLAQLHQLRGRVGRGAHQSYCVLFTNSTGEVAKSRMHIMKESTNGFFIAEKDLELRGPGDFFGTQQHGLPQFRVANLYEDMAILKEAQSAAQSVIRSGAEYGTFLENVRKMIPQTIAL
ncbi:MAG: ATP-dependent DNA helicase RecG [Clostridia bacterium]|nr:ATP-dependent DNA helicase RecG [Clostridia bacterium]